MALKVRTEDGLVHTLARVTTDGYSVRGYPYTTCGRWLSPRPLVTALTTCLGCVAPRRFDA